MLATSLSSNQTKELLFLFVVLPFLVAGLVIAFVSWRSSSGPPPIRTSTILAEGQPAEGEVLAVKPLGSILEVRPMIRFSLRVRARGDDEPFDLEVVQSLPRRRGARDPYRRRRRGSPDARPLCRRHCLELATHGLGMPVWGSAPVVDHGADAGFTSWTSQPLPSGSWNAKKEL